MFIKILIVTFLLLASVNGYCDVDQNIDDANEYIAERWDLINRSVDTFFTNKKSRIEDNNSSIFLSSSFTKRESVNLLSEYDIKVRIHLPHITKRLKIVIEREQDDISNVLSDRSVVKKKIVSKDGRNVSTKKSRYTAGTNILLTKTKVYISYLHVGLRLDMPLNPSLKLDLKRDIKTNIVNIGLSQKVNFYRQEGLQEFSQLILNKELNDTTNLDLINSLVWTDETDIFILRNNLILSYDLGEEKSLSYSLGANAKFSPVFYYDSYDTSLSYRQLIYKDWLYATMVVGAEFPKANDFNDEKFVQLRMELFFKE